VIKTVVSIRPEMWSGKKMVRRGLKSILGPRIVKIGRKVKRRYPRKFN
jgi:hypothetical protein